jgi:hypothetical protein
VRDDGQEQNLVAAYLERPDVATETLVREICAMASLNTRGCQHSIKSVQTALCDRRLCYCTDAARWVRLDSWRRQHRCTRLGDAARLAHRDAFLGLLRIAAAVVNTPLRQSDP